MDYVLDIISPKKEIETVKLNEKLIEWGGNTYSCEPPQYVTDTDITFDQIENVQYFNKIIGGEPKNDTIVLHLKKDILFDLEYVINNDESTLEENKLFKFLNELIKLSEFYILMIREDENVKERYRISTEEEIRARLSDSLRWSDPKDVLIYKKMES